MGNRRIKIWFVILAALTIAALAYTFAGAASIRATADEVEYVQKESCGDPSAAEGASAVFSNSTGYGPGISWTAELSFSGGRDEIKVSHRFFETAEQRTSAPYWNQIQIEASFDKSPEIDALAREIALGIKPGEHTVAEIRMSDILDYVPVMAHYYIGTSSYYSFVSYNADTKQQEVTYEVNGALGELFRKMMPEDLVASLRVNRWEDKNGEMGITYYIESMTEGDEDSNIMVTGQYYDGAFYIFHYMSRPYGSFEPLADGSDPYKVYRLPVKDEGLDEYNKTYYGLDMDSISVIGEYEEGFDIFGSSVMADGTGAMVVGTAGGRFKAYVIDFAQGGSLQALDLGPETEDHTVVFKDDWFLLEAPGDGYYVVYPEGGAYAVFFAPTDGSVEAADLHHIQPYEHYRAFDAGFRDGKLIVSDFAGIETTVIRPNGYTYKGVQGNGISLAVYSENGLEYYVRYESSLYGLRYYLISEGMCSTEVRLAD